MTFQNNCINSKEKVVEEMNFYESLKSLKIDHTVYARPIFNQIKEENYYDYGRTSYQNQK
jgi:hypothetical protein